MILMRATQINPQRQLIITGLLAALLLLLALACYWGTATYFAHTETPGTAYFNLLADAFLNGRLYLLYPPETLDLTGYLGRWYVPFPPLAALLMLPVVAVQGVAGLNTVFFCSLFGAANVSLIFLILSTLAGRDQAPAALGDRLWLTLLFGLGSVHWYMATIGSVWFVAQICTVTFVALAVWAAAAGRSGWLVGTALALAVLSRPTVIFTWPLLAALVFTHPDQQAQPFTWRRWFGWTVATAVPIGLAVGALLCYNQARFGNWFDFGYLNENVADELATNLRRYGQFNLYYLPKNLWAMWLAGPQWDADLHFWVPNPEGMSLLLTTPAIIYLARARRPWRLAVGGWLALGLLMIPLLLYYNTGWWQFGYRFSLDFMVPVMVLLALAAGKGLSANFRLLISLGVLGNLYGVLWWHA